MRSVRILLGTKMTERNVDLTFVILNRYLFRMGSVRPARSIRGQMIKRENAYKIAVNQTNTYQQKVDATTALSSQGQIKIKLNVFKILVIMIRF